MTAASEKLAALRRQLAERFPSTHHQPGRALRTGIPALDEITGGLPLAAITELVCAAPSSGSHLLLAHLLAITRTGRTRVALIDSANSFDPGSMPGDLLTHVLWVRCHRPSAPVSKSITLALHATDLLVRDSNFGLVVLDLRCTPETDLRRIPSPQWYRFQRAVEATDIALIVVTPRAAVPSAQLRLLLNIAHDATALISERPTLIVRLAPVLQRQRFSLDPSGNASAG